MDIGYDFWICLLKNNNHAEHTHSVQPLTACNTHADLYLKATYKKKLKKNL